MAVTKYLTKIIIMITITITLKEGLVWVHGLRVQPTTAGRSWW